MTERKKIYIFGNPLLPFDSLPITLAPLLAAALPNFDFIIADPNENLKPVNKELVIIDTVEGINEVVLIDDIDKIQSAPLYSLHDFDLGFNLKLLKKIGELERVKIIGVPMRGEEEKIFDKIIEIIRDIT